MNISPTANSSFFPTDKDIFWQEKEQKDGLLEEVAMTAKSQSPSPEIESDLNKTQLNAAVIDAMCNLF
ncbi:MAG: hypothetical protein WA865_03705 [Spirulinaceae cyanobacterium]